MTRFISTAYGPPWVGIQGTGVTATGIDLRPARMIYIVAVDPNVIPLHSHLTAIPNPFGDVVVFRAEDTGSAIKGRHIDFYDWRGRKRQLAWGTRYTEVNVLGAGAPPSRPAPVTPHSAPFPSRPGIEGNPSTGGPTNHDYSPILRSAGVNVRRTGSYLIRAGDAIRRQSR